MLFKIGSGIVLKPSDTFYKRTDPNICDFEVSFGGDLLLILFLEAFFGKVGFAGSQYAG